MEKKAKPIIVITPIYYDDLRKDADSMVESIKKQLDN